MIPDLPPLPADAPPVGSRWRHWKGQCVACVLSIGYNSETLEILVSYLEEQSGVVFFRPLSMWTEEVAPGVQRFTLIELDEIGPVEEEIVRELCECGRELEDCIKYDDPDAMKHGDRQFDGPIEDPEYEENKRIVEDVSRRVGGLTGSEVRDIMNGD